MGFGLSQSHQKIGNPEAKDEAEPVVLKPEWDGKNMADYHTSIFGMSASRKPGDSNPMDSDLDSDCAPNLSRTDHELSTIEQSALLSSFTITCEFVSD